MMLEKVLLPCTAGDNSTSVLVWKTLAEGWHLGDP